MTRPTLRDRASILLAALLFSTGGVAIKWVGLSGLEVAGLRAAVAATAIALLVPGPVRLARWSIAATGLAQGGAMLFFVLANKKTTAANAIFLQSTAPLFLPFLASRLLGERPTKRDYAAMVGIAAGMSCFFFGAASASATAPDPRTGDLLALVSGMSWAGTITGLRYLARTHPGVDDDGSAKGALLWGNALVALVSLPSVLAIENVTTADVAGLVYLGVAQVALAYRFLVQGVRAVPALEASLLILFEPVLNPLWAFVLLGERPTSWALTGASVLCAVTIARALAGSRSAA